MGSSWTALQMARILSFPAEICEEGLFLFFRFHKIGKGVFSF